jgi:hypothetical protein
VADGVDALPRLHEVMVDQAHNVEAVGDNERPVEVAADDAR